MSPAARYHGGMPARDQILQKVRKHFIDGVPHPDRFGRGMLFDDPVAQFRSVLEAVGGRCEDVATLQQASALLEAVPEYASAAKRYSGVAGVGRSTFALDSHSDPHDLEDVEYSVLPGELAVAENAAIWVTTPDVRVRTLYFLVQHLAMVVPRSAVVSNMHQAYQQIDVTKNAFGTWLSGPSKTADIEQSLVKGAHGSRSLLVLLLDDAPSDTSPQRAP
jgi:L-lactate dehydrogenase complex protein LldG